MHLSSCRVADSGWFPAAILIVCAAQATPQEAEADAAAAKFGQLDRDGNAQLSSAEFIAGVGAEHRAEAQREFRVFDSDSDGALTLDEFRNVPLYVAAEDRGPLRDPLVDRATETMTRIDGQWAECDGNRDGALSEDEFTKSSLGRAVLPGTSLADWDHDGDGRLTRDECRHVVEVAWGVRRPQGDLLRRDDGRSISWMGFKLIDRDGDDALTLEECRRYGYDGDRTDAVFGESDRDGDGRVSFVEWSATPIRAIGAVWEFLRIDADLDGSVTAAELESGAPSWQQPLAQYVIPGFDDNRDGQLALYEYLACPLACLQHRWHEARHDADHDGRLSFDEFSWHGGIDTAALERDYFRRLDRNADGALDIEEFFFRSNGVPPSRLFALWDRNRDGRLQAAEFAAPAGPFEREAQRDFRLYDFNADGSLDVAEFATARTVFAAAVLGPLPCDPIVDFVDGLVTVLEERWDKLDTNQDSKLNVDTFVRLLANINQAPLHSVNVQVFDPNADRNVTRAEARTAIEALAGVRRIDGAPLRMPSGIIVNLMHFRHLDRDSSDSLDRDEFLAHPFPENGGAGAFERGDGNADGRISFEEWSRITHPGTVDPVAEFRYLDGDFDGRLSQEELRTRAPDWKQKLTAHLLPAFDADGDGTLSLVEYRFCPAANPLLVWHAPLLDPDNDGKLTFAEFAFGSNEFPLLRWEYFRRFDVNSDGLLDTREFHFHTKEPDALFVLNADGSGWRKLLSLDGYPALGSPAVSPDGKTIVFDAWQVVKNRQVGQSMLWAIDIDGQNPRELCAGQMPSWSPDGRFLACSRGGQGVCIVTADGKDHKQIGQGWGAQWSPDGRRIAFYESNARVMVYDVETGQLQEVLGTEANPYQQVYWNLTWSPDSTQLCVKGTTSSGAVEIALVNAGGAELGFRVRYSSRTPFHEDFAWHPQGDRVIIAMPCPERGRSQLYEFRPDDDAPPGLLAGQDPERNNTDSAWTPDGRQLIVSSGDY